MALSAPPDGDGFEQLEPAHQDVVTVLHYNFYGKRKVTGSADHRLKVYDRQSDGTWKLIDTWRGHDAEIIDIKWTTPYMGSYIGSIGEDQKFKVWQEDIYELPNSGRRFKCISTLQSSSRIPFVSFDFKSVNSSDVHVALLSRDALLTVYEANEPGSMASWALADQFHVCSPPSRGEETTFKVAFDPNPLPCWTACRAGVPRDALSLITAGMNTAKIWRTGNQESDDGRRHFYLAADLSSWHHRHGLVRDVAWAEMNVRGWDVIATTCTDGYIRVFEIRCTGGGGSDGQGQGGETSLLSSTNAMKALESPSKKRGVGGGVQRTASTSSHQRGVSGISAELAGVAGSGSASTMLPTTPSLTRRPSRQREDHHHHHHHQDQVEGGGQVVHTVEQIASIRDRYGGVWQVSFRSNGT
ncbi:MAG: epoxide hydrolase, soluble (sEH) [Watsoniomyces obsoletus]|nr:MAG: epoxide hydrolase, soluble (sEH) [Watsoniomyces obsoletus]